MTELQGQGAQAVILRRNHLWRMAFSAFGV